MMQRLAWVLCLLLSGNVAAQTHRVVATSQHCRPLTVEQQAWLPTEWAPYHDYTRACAIRDSKGRPVLFLVSVWAALYYRSQSEPVVEQVEMPRPLLFLPSGQVAGDLPSNFPDDPPAALRVTFAHWTHEFPQRIELFQTDPRAGGSRALPSLRWDPGRLKYTTGE